MFLNCPFRFLNKSSRTFAEKFLADFQKSALGVQRNSLWKAVSQKKLWNQNFLRNFLTNLGLLVETFRPICQNCILPVEQIFEENRYSRVWIWLVTFLDIERKLSRVWRNFLRKFHKTAFYMSEGETLVLSNFWRENFDCENFFNF